jgi:uncharacterized protein YjbI with pentapeptide repeats
MRSAARPAVAVLLVFVLTGVLAVPANAAVGSVGSCLIKQATSCVGADLRGADLTNASLQGADLRHANLTGANLTGANLAKANLAGANLTGAKLVSVKADGVNLSSVLLQNSDLSHGQFELASFDGSQLDFANLTRAYLRRIHAHATNFAHAEMNNADVIQGDLSGSNFFGTHVHGTNFDHATIANTAWTGAYFLQTKFLGAYDIGTAKLTPSTVGSDDVARFYLFDRVYAHVNAYHQYGSCSDHGEGAISCTGYNDDPAATYAFNEGHRSVSFGWGRSNENPRTFFITGAHGVTFRGSTNGNFGIFAITQVENFPGVPTALDAPPGEVGGPLALYLGHHGPSGWNIFDPGGYHLNFRGWVQRTGQAPTTAPR